MADGDLVSVRAEMPVLGIPRGGTATVVDSPAVRTMVANGYLTRLEAPAPAVSSVEDPPRLADEEQPTETPGSPGETEQATPVRRRRRTNPSSKES